MSEARDSNFPIRLWRTPMRDLFRFQLSCRLDWRRPIVQASIPDETKTLLAKLVRRTRLWRIEKADIAHELVAHFEDAIAAGQSGDEIVELFGDWSRTAKLIRRATKRKRNLLWHTWRWAFWSVIVLIGLYTAMGVYYFTGSRNIAVDYAELMNQKAIAVPQGDRAWPVVRGSMLAMGYTQPPPEPKEGEPDVRALIAKKTRPGDPDWPAVAAFLEEHWQPIDGLRRAADMPGLGFVAGYQTDVVDLPLFDPGKTLQEHEADAQSLKGEYADEPPMVWMIRLEHLTSLRSAARVLSVDTFRALDAADADADAAYANLVAMLGIAGHADEQDTLLNQLVTLSIRQLAYQTFSEVVASYPDAFSREQLAGLAHQVAAVRGYKLSFEGERDFMLDLLQHLYTDNGKGNGHMDVRAWRRMAVELSSLEGYSVISNEPDLLSTVIGTAMSPAAIMIVADRKDLTTMSDWLYTLYEAEVSLPMWEHPESKAEAELVALIEGSLYQKTRYFPIAVTMPALGAVRKVAERHTAHADGLLTALALELYKADHGGYPTGLETLVPRYLPTMPIDRITGGPLRYHAKGDRPTLYSVGADRDDDAGTIAYDKVGDRDPAVVQWVIPEGEQPTDGDWVVWPLHD